MTKRQTKKGSFLEAASSTAIAFAVSACAWEFIVAPAILAGYVDVRDSIIITLFFTVLSLLRSYVIRRIGNRWIR